MGSASFNSVKVERWVPRITSYPGTERRRARNATAANRRRAVECKVFDIRGHARFVTLKGRSLSKCVRVGSGHDNMKIFQLKI